MKKTIIALMALAGVAMAADTGTLTLTNTTASDTITTTISDNSTDWLKEAIALGGNATIDILTSGSNTYTPTDLAGYAIGDTNVGNGGSYVYSVSFTVNGDAPALTLTSISADFIVKSADGGNQGNSRWATYNWQFVSGETTLVDYATADYWSQASGATGSLSMDFGSNAIDLEAGETYTLNLKITGVNDSNGTVDNKGGFVHVGSISASIIPEPTTATLSLLALAGLAARRRRK